MAQDIDRIAERLGAKVLGQVPETGGGAFGAARLVACIERLQARQVSGLGKRAGSSGDASGLRYPKIPLNETKSGLPE